MKKMIVFIIVAVMLFTVVACGDNATNGSSQGVLIVDGQTIKSNTTIYPEYATVSLCDVVSALGFELSWNGTDSASFYCNGIKYEICISQKTLIREGEDVNYLLCAPGNAHYICNVVEDVLIVDNNTLYCLFSTFINYPINVTVDHENNSLIITRK